MSEPMHDKQPAQLHTLTTTGAESGRNHQRLRKAWAIRTKCHKWLDADDIIFAPTRSKARGKRIFRLLDSWSCEWTEAARSIVTVRRAPAHDVLLPPPHPIASKLSDEHLEIVTHAYGGPCLKAGRRDYFYTMVSDPNLCALVAAGLFRKGADLPTSISGGEPYAYFFLTEIGKEVAMGQLPEYPQG